jgi:multicomponent Na+:H+ antiporter subunit F
MLITLLFGMLSVALMLAFVRLVLGPSLPDRVVALDLIATLAVGFTGIYAIAVDQPIFLDLALVLSLIIFLGTVAFAYFIEKGELPWRQS